MVSTPSPRYRRSHDPYNDMPEAEIRPRNILSQAENEASHTSKPRAAEKVKNIVKKRKPSEKPPTNPLKHAEQDQTSTQITNSTFRNSVRGVQQAAAQKSKLSTLKKAGPLGAIVAIIFGGGALFSGVQSLLAPTISNLFTQQTDLQFTSYSLRNQRLMKFMLDGGDQIKISNFTKKYTTFTPYMKKRLANNGIEVGYLDANGNFKSDQVIANRSTVLKYGDEIIDANSFQDVYARDANFRESYYNAKRGRIAGFFDDASERNYKKRGETRDIFDKYKSTGDADTDLENFHSTVSDRVTGVDGDINTVRRETDDNGDETIAKNGDDLETSKVSGDTPEAKARSFVNGIAGKVSSVGVPVCSVLRIANIATVAISAYQIAQSAAYFHSFMESISKTMAGEGDAAAINETLNTMTTPYDSEVSYINNSGEQVSKTVNGSMLQSAGAKIILGNTQPNESEYLPYAINNITKAATRIALSTGITTSTCSGVMAASAIVSLTANAIPGGSLAKFAVYAVAQTIGGVVITGAVALLINAALPQLIKIFASDIFESYTGIPAGNLFATGAAATNSSVSRSASALMPASTENVKTQNRQAALVNADEIAIDRKRRSPFDTSSPNTFLGSIVSNFSYLSYSSSFSSNLSNFATLTSRSLQHLTPASSASDQDFTYTAINSECDGFSGVACDIYGMPIVATDYSTIDITPDDPTYNAVLAPNLESDGSTIKDNSELAKFINFCANRESPWGVTDANILNALQTDGGIVVNNIPIVNDVIDVINAAEDIANQKWATGENCTNSSANPRWDTEFKYYQRYIEDMRILGDMENYTGGSNPVIAYEERYENSHPTDTSFKGTLARISGLTTDDIAFLMEFSRYSSELALYQPSTRFQFVATPEPTKLSFKQDNTTYAIISDRFYIQTDKRGYTV